MGKKQKPLRPMLARDFRDREGDIDWLNAFAHPVYGTRRLLTSSLCSSESCRLIDKNGRSIKAPAEWNHFVVSGMTLDGEMRDGVFYVYDALMSMPYSERLAFIEKHVAGNRRSFCRMADVIVVGCRDDLLFCHQRFLGQGLEGTILRHGTSSYDCGRSSSRMLRVGEFREGMFEVVDIKEGVGEKEGTVVLICISSGGGCFEAPAPGGLEELRKDWPRRFRWLGRKVKAKYHSMTTGDEPVPRFPVILGYA